MYNNLINLINSLSSGTVFRISKEWLNQNNIIVMDVQVRSLVKRFAMNVQNGTVTNVKKHTVPNNQGNFLNKNTANHAHYVKVWLYI